ncbi:MAG: site-2 protease family protein [Micromonosporaceae bacterium]|nr:site-2 protease family protein [Micromonosporaceae bacterium]
MDNDHPSTRPRRQTERRSAGVPLGGLFGVPLRLSPTWLPLAALVTYGYGQLILTDWQGLPAAVAYVVGFAFALCLVGSVLLHEVGHALASRRFGIGVRGITIEAMGGYTEMAGEARSPGVEVAVSLAGPAVSLGTSLACALAAGVFPALSLGERVAWELAIANLVVAVFNALPGLPLDGGRALQALVWSITGDRLRGQRVAGWAGRIIAGSSLAAALILYGAGVISLIGMIVTALVAVTVWTGAGQAITMVALADRFGGVEVARLMRPLVVVEPGTPLAEALWVAGSAGVTAPVIGVAREDGEILGLISEAAAAAVPAERLPWITVDSLVRHLGPGQVVDLGLRGLDLLEAVGADPTADYLVVEGEDVIGVLRGADLSTLLEAKGLISRRTAR